ncbi:MAG: hypothetical protein ACTHLR_11515, partial [Rhizomicrobium sp.]
MSSNALKDAGSDSADAAHAAQADEARALRTIAAGRKLLKGNDAALAHFYDALFAGAPPEDITRYAPESLAALASFVFNHSARRVPGDTLVDVFSFNAQDESGARTESVLVAVNDDMPFLFDSLSAALSAQGIRVHALFHPIVSATRGSDGTRNGKGQSIRESVIVMVLEGMVEGDRAASLIENAQGVFAQVRLAVRDWTKMQAHLAETVAALRAHPPADNAEELKESIAFLEWLGDNHFTFLGARDYTYSDRDSGHLDPIAHTGLGVLSDASARVVGRRAVRGARTPAKRAVRATPGPLIKNKNN